MSSVMVGPAEDVTLEATDVAKPEAADETTLLLMEDEIDEAWTLYIPVRH